MKELTKPLVHDDFKLETPLVSMVYTKIFQRFKEFSNSIFIHFQVVHLQLQVPET